MKHSKGTQNTAPGWRAPKRRKWTEADGRAMLEALAESGLADREFAERQGIAAHKVYYWRRRLREKEAGFVPVQVTGARAESDPAERRIEVELRAGQRLRFVGAWDPDAMAPWLEALRRWS